MGRRSGDDTLEGEVPALTCFMAALRHELFNLKLKYVGSV
jgi:hypothetical protein